MGHTSAGYEALVVLGRMPSGLLLAATLPVMLHEGREGAREKKE